MGRGNGQAWGHERGKGGAGARGTWLKPKDIRAQLWEVIAQAQPVGGSFEGGLPDRPKQEGSLQFAKDCLK